MGIVTLSEKNKNSLGRKIFVFLKITFSAYEINAYCRKLRKYKTPKKNKIKNTIFSIKLNFLPVYFSANAHGNIHTYIHIYKQTYTVYQLEFLVRNRKNIQLRF